MNNKKLINFIIFLPFAISIGAFILYLRYYYALKGTKTLKVTEVIGSSLVRYRNIGIFCLIIGVLLLLVKVLYDYFKIENTIDYKEEKVLDKISSKKYENEAKYSFEENTIISDLLGNKKLKLKYINTNDSEDIVKFENYDKKKNLIEFTLLSKNKNEVKKQVVKKVKKESNFNPVRFAVNMIVILLCIILLLLCLNKIKGQSEINKNNLNIKTVEIN